MIKMFSFFPSGKAQGMSLKVIIVAVICIVVLVVLIMIFAGKTRFFSSVTSSCDSRGGSCDVSTDGKTCPEGYLTHRTAACPEEGQICCASFDAQPAKTGEKK
jgi:hypothetical protein